MPGMMDTILNLGLNDDNVKSLLTKQMMRFAYDCYRRLLQMFGEVVYGIPMTAFDTYFNDFKQSIVIKMMLKFRQKDYKLYVKI